MRLHGTAWATNSGHIAALIWPGFEGKPQKQINCNSRINKQGQDYDFKNVLILGSNPDSSAFELLAQVHTDEVSPINHISATSINLLPAQLESADKPEFYATIDRLSFPPKPTPPPVRLVREGVQP